MLEALPGLESDGCLRGVLAAFDDDIDFLGGPNAGAVFLEFVQAIERAPTELDDAVAGFQSRLGSRAIRQHRLDHGHTIVVRHCHTELAAYHHVGFRLASQERTNPLHDRAHEIESAETAAAL